MRRLLQGDVGSGKTVVAALACLQAIENGFQAAFMAPTEILAEQHYRKLAPPLSALGVRCAWVSGSQRKSERTAAWQAIAAGEADLAFGTHALFQEGGAFAQTGAGGGRRAAPLRRRPAAGAAWKKAARKARSRTS